MLVDYPVPIGSEKERAVSQNYTGRRFKTHSGVLCQSLEKPRSMVLRCYCEIDEHDRVARFPVSSPCPICRQFLERGWDLLRIAPDIEPHRFKNSRDHIANVSSD